MYSILVCVIFNEWLGCRVIVLEFFGLKNDG